MRRGAPAWILVLAATVVAASPGCARRGPRAAARASVVALVGDRPVEYTDFAAYVKAAAGDEPKSVSPRVSSSLLDQYLDEALFERAVEDARPPTSGADAPARRRELISRRAGLDRLSEDELRREYDGHPERYKHPAVVRVSQLLFTSRDKAESAVKKLAAGVPWHQVSRELSAAPNAGSGGSLGLLAQSDLPREFEKVVWALPAGGTTDILPAPHGFHIFRVEERFESKEIRFAEALPALRVTLAEEKSTRAAQELVAEARKRHPVTVVEEHLPFPYVGSLPRFVETK